MPKQQTGFRPRQGVATDIRLITKFLLAESFILVNDVTKTVIKTHISSPERFM